MEQKTELPTEKKKEDSAKKGQIFISRDFVGFLSLMGIAGFVYLTLSGDDLTFYFDIFSTGFVELSLEEYTKMVCITALRIIASIVGVSIFLAVLLTMIQTRFHFASEAIRIDFSSINPVSGFKKIFSMRSLKDSIKSIMFLFMAVCGIVIFVIKYHQRIFSLPYSDLTHFIAIWRGLLPLLVLYMLIPILVVIAFDALAEFFLYIKDLMMTKQEIKQEYKNNEGNPEIKSKRKQVHQEMLSEQTKSDIRGSKFILANPTHIAIGIFYHSGFMATPFISLVEKNAKAIAVIKYAEANNVPVLRNISLARAIYKTAQPFMLVENTHLVSLMQIINWLEQVENAGKIEPEAPQDTETSGTENSN
ncbi:EscU/YscU/HrcU family type III secretion system export apparatus switch protein [Citrobacter amalonaticus]|uniref:EscU/YscU/HrcU family type III secretion system export apparatus switch protein n=1 Tax=Citrobacter amalonaticus TaxID=35703 RepID=A0A2S4S2J4_CITAM|nr:EscU/YscU/HrcU family type III secretion system export apparatus switch protein [Citrobacter amalonaticus]POT59498.1 EscU/YscU/HrcU family type III secretion system export apparatus switch protein [Citrobacter amalonaticus]POT77628.1 EscU/YscU/HrcU family type III secretion system export apparatus switch protein [Citrobacter amalonaticus]POU68080.1 EscU/YscU/HrcU family type III secretion system export apparatus switch protein [Citrobacter amalonaticus]POV07684.1 EscU/YscU/HrcU family type I